MLSGLPVKVLAGTPLLDLLSTTANDKILIVIQLNGGNDGLNMIIPIDQYAALSKVRSNILIDEKKVLKLGNTTVTGLHPSMTGIQNIYNSGKVRFLHDVGYNPANYSHFRSLDIWLQANSDTTVPVTTGWMGRYLDQQYPGYPNGYPNDQDPDPLAIQMGSVVSSGLMGQYGIDGIAITDPANFAQLARGNNVSENPPSTAYGRELSYIRRVTGQTQKYTDSVKKALTKGALLSSAWPQTGNDLASQLKLVAQMIAGGLKTKIYLVSQGGYDTHFNQVTTGATDQGAHASLLGNLSTAIYAFQDEMYRHSLEDRVVGITFSEFGRRIVSNGSLGTDHGTAAPMITFGTQVIPGALGKNPTITSGPGSADNLTPQTDFRQVYNSILKDWFGLSAAQLATVLPHPDGGNWEYVEIIKQPGKNYIFNKPDLLGVNMPNPFHSVTTIPFYAYKGRTILELWDVMGRKQRTLFDAVMTEGSSSVQFDGQNLAPGIYYYRITTGGLTKTLPMIKA